MSKKKDIERAKRDGPFRQPGTPKPDICPFPGCGRTFTPEEAKSPCCNYHRQFISDLIFALSKISPQAIQGGPEDGPKILVVKPGMEKQAIEEAKRARLGKGP